MLSPPVPKLNGVLPAPQAAAAAQRVARGEIEDSARDVMAKIDPYREIEILPPGMVNGNTLRRKRGDSPTSTGAS